MPSGHLGFGADAPAARPHSEPGPARLDGTVVHILDPDCGVRTLLATVLRAAGCVAHPWDHPATFLSHYDGHPACLIMELDLPDMAGPEVHLHALARNLPLGVVYFAARDDFEMAIGAMKAGAVEFLRKPVEMERLPGVLEAAAGRAIAAAKTAETARRLARLTPRENEVGACLARGMTNKETARALGISPRTVETHRANLCVKLGTNKTAELILLFAEHA